MEIEIDEGRNEICYYLTRETIDARGEEARYRCRSRQDGWNFELPLQCATCSRTRRRNLYFVGELRWHRGKRTSRVHHFRGTGCQYHDPKPDVYYISIAGVPASIRRG